MLTKEEHKQNVKEFKKFFIEDTNRLRNSENISLKKLSEQSHIPLLELEKISSGKYENWGALFQLARFFNRKIRIMFY